MAFETTPVPLIKYCFVPTCKNNSDINKEKNFFCVPANNKAEWCRAVGKIRTPKSKVLFICDDHLNLEEDMANYVYWKTMKHTGNVRARLKTQPPVLKNVSPALLNVAATSVSSDAEGSVTVPQAVSQGHSHGSKPEESTPAADYSQNDHEEDTLPNSDMPLQKSDVDESTIFSWQIENFDNDEEVLGGHWPDEAETSMYQDQDEAMVEISILPDETEIKINNSALPDEDYTYRCNNCGENITGFRYTCVQCADWDLCGACEARAAHAAHYVLRVPSPRPCKETQAILAAIRRQLLNDKYDNVFLPDESDGLKIEIKEEPGVKLEPQAEDDPLGVIIKEEYVEEMTSEPESIVDHQLPRKRARLHSQSDENVTYEVTVTNMGDDDFERPKFEPNVDAWDRPHKTPEETVLDDQTTIPEGTKSVIESQHSEMQGRTFFSHQNILNEDSRNNTHCTDSNTLLHKRREVKVIPESRLKSKTRRMVLKGVKVNAKSKSTRRISFDKS